MHDSHSSSLRPLTCSLPPRSWCVHLQAYSLLMCYNNNTDQKENTWERWDLQYGEISITVINLSRLANGRSKRTLLSCSLNMRGGIALWRRRIVRFRLMHKRDLLHPHRDFLFSQAFKLVDAKNIIGYTSWGLINEGWPRVLGLPSWFNYHRSKSDSNSQCPWKEVWKMFTLMPHSNRQRPMQSMQPLIHLLGTLYLHFKHYKVCRSAFCASIHGPQCVKARSSGKRNSLRSRLCHYRACT